MQKMKIIIDIMNKMENRKIILKMEEDFIFG